MFSVVRGNERENVGPRAEVRDPRDGFEDVEPRVRFISVKLVKNKYLTPIEQQNSQMRKHFIADLKKRTDS